MREAPRQKRIGKDERADQVAIKLCAIDASGRTHNWLNLLVGARLNSWPPRSDQIDDFMHRTSEVGIGLSFVRTSHYLPNRFIVAYSNV